MTYFYPKHITTSYYAKKNAPELTFEYIISEVDKDIGLIQRGDHPYIGYIDRKNPKCITDAWWM